jgi:hypothetical protein
MKNCIVTFCHRLRLWIKKNLLLRFRLVRQGRLREGQAQAFLHRSSLPSLALMDQKKPSLALQACRIRIAYFHKPEAQAKEI